MMILVLGVRSVTYLERAHICSDTDSLPIGSAGTETSGANNRVGREAFSPMRQSRCGCRAVVADKPVRICGRNQKYITRLEHKRIRKQQAQTTPRMCDGSDDDVDAQT